jgi:hypothetical protein
MPIFGTNIEKINDNYTDHCCLSDYEPKNTQTMLSRTIIPKAANNKFDIEPFCAFYTNPIKNPSLFYTAEIEWFASLNAEVASFPALSKSNP